MTTSRRLRSIILNDWIIAAFLLGVFLLTTGYKYPWDDQHLEIPLLKHLIDPTLFVGDYYVESLKKNFSSYFYPILARFITVDQVPAAYFFLYVVSRYFLFFWSYKLWRLITGRASYGILCALSFFIIVRVDEFLYRTFSHQEFTLAIIFAGIYFFFRNRLILASVILGVAANFHALYSLFPMIFIGIYMLLNLKEVGWKKLFLSCAGFVIGCLPFLIWIIKNRLSAEYAVHPSLAEWTALFQQACPQNFILPLVPFSYLVQNLKAFFNYTDTYLFLILLFTLNIAFNRTFRFNRQAMAYCIGAFLLLIVSLIFTYIHPIRSVVDLNLIRNSQYLLYLLIGFTTFFALTIAVTKKPFYGFVMGLLLSLLKYGQIISINAAILMIIVAGIIAFAEKKQRIGQIILSLLALPFVYFIFQQLRFTQFSFFIQLNFLILVGLLAVTYVICELTTDQKKQRLLKHLFIVIPFLIFTAQFMQYGAKQVKLETEGGNYFWSQQNAWEDMQRYVKEHTPKEAIVLIPYNTEMCGFRIGSERKIVVSYRDSGIVGFDYQAALEWQKRIEDVSAFTIAPDRSFVSAIQNAVTKYGANYIVFMRFASPTKDMPGLKRLYTNQHFVLFEIRR